MNIQIIGSGYVGLPTAVGFNMLLANRGGVISVIDIDKDRIKNLQSKKSIFYEKKLNEELLKQNNIQFSCDFKNVKNQDIIFICVPTPNDKNNQIDLSYIKSVIDSIYKYLKNGVLLCIKSTVIPGSTLSIKKLLQKKNPKLKFHIACVPEFLKEGSALEDFLNPDRIICGVEDERSKELLTKLYNNSDKLFFTSINDAEMIKYASNSFLSLKVAFINELANLCEKSNCDINLVSLGMGLDKRIAPYFLNASIGYGGSC
ncbi:UDP-glucose/GDP-mannose dehydrogenase family protein, partial [Campylobacter canadensis]